MPTTRYESTEAPTGRRVYGAGTLGQRDSAGLAAAFTRPPLPSGVSDALTYAIQNMENIGTGTGEEPNLMFPQYRRNFVPAGGTLTQEYVLVRDKTTVTPAAGTGLGTAYSPTIASPGEGEGINPARLRFVAGAVTAVLLDATDSNGPNPLYNPTNEAHKTRSDAGSIDNTGGVRRFKLGIASSTQTTLTENNNRGQFPGQPIGPTPPTT